MIDAALNLEPLPEYIEMTALDEFFFDDEALVSSENRISSWGVDGAGNMARAVAYHQAGQLKKAQQIYKHLLNMDPDHYDALHLSGVIAYQIGKYDIAVSLIARAIHGRPDHPIYYNNLGSVFQAQGNVDKATICYQNAIQIQPDYAEAYYNMGNVLSGLGNFHEAIKQYRKALDFAPNYLDACYNLANCYKKLKKYNRAITWYQSAIAMNPNHAESHNNMGSAYKSLNQWEAATACYQRVLQIVPDSAEACYNLAHTFQCRGKIKEAVPLYQRALEFCPDYAKAYNNIGKIFQDQGMISDAIFCFQKVLAVKPDFVEALNNLGICYKDMGLLQKAVACYQRALTIAPGFSDVHSNFLYSMNFQEELDANQVFKEHQTWAVQHTAAIKQMEPLKDMVCLPDKRLRIGYVSPDFRNHPIACFMEPLIAGHARSSFQVYCYSDTSNADSVTGRLKSKADIWRDIFGLSDTTVAEMIQKDRIDILVDLAGHTANHRLRLFARKPARIQLAYLGYPNTSGLAEIQYRITDSWADPPGMTDHLYTEDLIRLPSGFLCYMPKQEMPLISKAQPCSEGRVRFGSFNQRAKITRHVISVWSEILSQLPHAELVLKSKVYQDANVQKMIADGFAQHGIAPERIRFLGHHVSEVEHLNSYQDIDVCLDTFPYNGTTTTCDALWMGVPVISLAGQVHVSRVGVSLLRSIGTDELIANSTDAYIQKSVELAKDPSRLQTYRNSLRESMLGSELMDCRAFCRKFENALREIWKQ